MIELGDDVLHVYVDGSSLSGPRRGGVGIRYAWIKADGQEAADTYPRPYSYEGGRIGQMELTACIEALKLLVGRHPPIAPGLFQRIVIHTDSIYVAENYPNAKWGHWQKAGWVTKDGTPVHNKKEWEELVRLHKRLDRDFHVRLEIEWIPGKSDAHTKAVDKMAKNAAKSPLQAKKRDHQRVRRKWSPHKAQRGAVALHGQDEIIRLVTDSSMAGHRSTFHYMYEVVDDGSLNFQLVDYVYSSKMLSAGHIYRVTFNDDAKNPRILDAQEIERDSIAARYIALSCGQKDPLLPDTNDESSEESEDKTGTRLSIEMGDRVEDGTRVGTLRSGVEGSDGTFICKVAWEGVEFCDYLFAEDLHVAT